jgi:hypothetical protein
MTRTPLAVIVALLLLGASALGGADPLDRAGDNEPEIAAFVEAAVEKHGEDGRRAAAFLVEHMSERDLRSLGSELLIENLDCAMRARAEFDWCRTLPEEIFLNDVLPYASLDETRERWRPAFFEQCRDIVKGCSTAAEAAQALNRELFNAINVHYNTGRKRPNQSPAESIEQGRATCTGLSIILVDACRAVGVPARVAGTALWSNKRGNHTWVEVWDDGVWRFTGADEYDANGLDRAWFTADASRAIEDDWRHAIWATSWRRTGDHFPLVWNLEDKTVPAVNVTRRYASDAASDGDAGTATVHLRVSERPAGPRLETRVDVIDGSGAVVASVTTKAGQADMNDMPAVTVEPGLDYTLRLRAGGVERATTLRVDEPGESTRDLVWSGMEGTPSVAIDLISRWLGLLPEERHLSIPAIALSREEADEATRLIFEERKTRLAPDRRAEMAKEDAGVDRGAATLTIDGHAMRFKSRRFGAPPESGPSLWISMHGGGNASPQTNTSQWRNQLGLYELEEGIYVAPRAPTDTWNLWHQPHIDDLFDRLIENFVLLEGVDPNRVYLLGYSAGGDGVYQLAPRMADRFAAAAMMAGHPNDASPLGLRNLPFALFMGADDGAYNRNGVAAEWEERLAELADRDPGGYPHLVRIYPDTGHWMNKKDRESIPWMARQVRDPWPARVVWRQSSRTHDRFYWLAVPRADARPGQTITAEVRESTVHVTTEGEGLTTLTLRLSDELLDLDAPVAVVLNGETVFEGKVDRSVAPIHRSLLQRCDPSSVATAEIEIGL